MTSRPKILAYYFPDWHRDRRNEARFGSAWTEWELVENATARYEGHRQPRVPLGGRFDEATPHSFDGQNARARARAHGVDGYIFDFYWYDDGPYLESALRDGFLAAGSSADLDFAIIGQTTNSSTSFRPAQLVRRQSPWNVERSGVRRSRIWLATSSPRTSLDPTICESVRSHGSPSTRSARSSRD